MYSGVAIGQRGTAEQSTNKLGLIGMELGGDWIDRLKLASINDMVVVSKLNRVTKARFLPGVFRNEGAILKAAVGKSIQSARSAA